MRPKHVLMTNAMKFVDALLSVLLFECCVLLSTSPVFAEDLQKVAVNLPQVHREISDPELTPAFLEQMDAVIGDVTIDNENIFDLDDPE